METNDIRNYNEILSIKYIERITPIKTDEDKDACLRFLTINNNSAELCHRYYNVEHINSVIEYSDCLIYFVSKENNDIVAFALVKRRGKY